MDCPAGVQPHRSICPCHLHHLSWSLRRPELSWHWASWSFWSQEPESVDKDRMIKYYLGLKKVILGNLGLYGLIWGYSERPKAFRWRLMGLVTKEAIGITLAQSTHYKEPWWCRDVPPPFPETHPHPRTRNPIRFQPCTGWSSYCTCPAWAIGLNEWAVLLNVGQTLNKSSKWSSSWKLQWSVFTNFPLAFLSFFSQYLTTLVM